MGFLDRFKKDVKSDAPASSAPGMDAGEIHQGARRFAGFMESAEYNDAEAFRPHSRAADLDRATTTVWVSAVGRSGPLLAGEGRRAGFRER